MATTPTEEAPGAAGEPAQDLPQLRCLGGLTPPPDLATDLHELTTLPPQAQSKLWDALSLCLSDPLPTTIEGALDGFCRRWDVPSGKLARVIKATRFVLRQSSAFDLDADGLRADLAVLVPADAEQLWTILAGGYEQAKSKIRLEIIRGSLADHGKELVGVDWRLDAVMASQRGVKLQAGVALLTLHCREGSRDERVTLQVLPDALKQLRHVCDQILAVPSKTDA